MNRIEKRLSIEFNLAILYQNISECKYLINNGADVLTKAGEVKLSNNAKIQAMLEFVAFLDSNGFDRIEIGRLLDRLKTAEAYIASKQEGVEGLKKLLDDKDKWRV